jgi:hypothetical protein
MYRVYCVNITLDYISGSNTDLGNLRGILPGETS